MSLEVVSCERFVYIRCLNGRGLWVQANGNHGSLLAERLNLCVVRRNHSVGVRQKSERSGAPEICVYGYTKIVDVCLDNVI